MPVRRGDIYFVDLNPVVGREQAGKRPVLVLSADEISAQPLVVTVVVGTKGANIARDYPVNVRVPAAQTGLPMDTVFLCFQIRSLDPRRFPDRPAGTMPVDAMLQVETVVRRCLGL